MELGLAEAGPSIEERVEGLLRGLLEAKARDPALSAALRSQLPRIDGYARVAQLLRRVEQLVAGLLAAHRKEAARIDPAWTAVVLTAGVDGVISSVLERDPARLRDPHLLRELCRMVLGICGPSEHPFRREPGPDPRHPSPPVRPFGRERGPGLLGEVGRARPVPARRP